MSTVGRRCVLLTDPRSASSAAERRPGHDIRRLKVAVGTAFFLPGLGMSSWVTQTPVIRDLVAATTAQMGIVLFGLSVGSMAGVLASGALVARWGARRVIVAGTMGISLSLVLVACGAAVGSQAAAMAGLGVFGLGMGSAEVALNVEGAEVETRTGRPFLPVVHGSYSLGTLVGSGFGILAVTFRVEPLWHLPVVAVVIAVALLRAARVLPRASGRTHGTVSVDTAAEAPNPPPSAAPPRRRPGVWRDPRLLLIAVITLAVALAEGTATDWLPLVMVDGHGLDPGLGSGMFAVFAASMTLGRFVGNPVVARLGRARVLAASAGFGVIGLGLVAFVDHPGVAVAAVVLWGLGTSLGFPVAISAAGASGDHPASRIALVSMIGYIALLAGPPVLGFAGEHWGLRTALVIPLAVLLVAVPLSRAATPAAQARARVE